MFHVACQKTKAKGPGGKTERLPPENIKTSNSPPLPFFWRQDPPVNGCVQEALITIPEGLWLDIQFQHRTDIEQM